MRILCRFVCLSLILLVTQASAQVVNIPDSNLESAIREALELPDEIPLTQPEMLRLRRLDAMDGGITNLSGLQHATSLQVLDLRDNLIGSISPLATLTQLIHLALDGNQIRDINPLTNLANLTHLGLSGNQIADIGPLMNLTNLRNIGLSSNQIRNISPLAGLIQLEGLGLSSNQISDLSPLANLTNLKTLYLSGGGLISDITPLANLTQLMRLRLSGQSISDITPIANLTQLIHLRLDRNQIDDISPLANLTLLEELRLNNNAIMDITPLVGLKNLKELWIADNPIYDFSPLLELEGVELDIEISEGLSGLVEIPDPNLEQAIREDLSLPEAVPLTQQQMLRLTELDAGGDRGIIDLTGLEYATQLGSINLGGNQIVDVSPLTNLVNLEIMSLWNNRVEDIKPLANLVKLRLINLADNQIVDISAITHWVNLDTLNLDDNNIDDISPLGALKNLEVLTLSENRISDASPLSELTNLTDLTLSKNYIADFSPLANLINLQKLWINENLGTDISPLQRLNLAEFRYDEICDIAPLLPPVKERIETRSFPSVFQIWGGIGWTPVVNRLDLSDEEHITLHDLYFSPSFQAIGWDATLTEPTYGVATQLAGNLEYAREVRQRWLDQNPNMVFLRSILIHERFTEKAFPSDSDFWLRDANGNIVRKKNTGEPLTNFLKPEVQQLIINRIIAIERCGLYDGLMLDGFTRNGTGFSGRVLYPHTDEEIIQAMLNIFRAVRAEVREDFLIIANGGDTKLDRYTEFINGTFMETGIDYPGGYSPDYLVQLGDTLSWSEENLRSPQINCLEGAGMNLEPPDGPNNLRWMRLFTTLSMTHSDGYVIYTAGISGAYHHHLWHDFWDTDLGHPIGHKAQPYQDIEGLFIREFTNGWAVYNRSGTAQTITLPASASPASDRGNNAAAQTHILPDLDGEIYLTTKSFADVNKDGSVNVLDLVQVANGFGQATPDPNGDGVVNILDLVFVTQQFSQSQ